MRIAAHIRGILILLLAVSGCRSRSDLVEAELRTKDRQLREAHEELCRTRMVNEALERDFMAKQQGLPLQTNSSLLPPKDITLGRGTGGVDDHRLPSDEALQVVVVPRDEDGNPIRVLGNLTVNASEIMPGGLKVPLSSWDVSAAELRRTWKSGLLSSGYQVVLCWKKPPTQSKLRVTAQLVLPDGRVYEAEKDITIRAALASIAPPAPIAPPLEKIPLIPPDSGPALK